MGEQDRQTRSTITGQEAPPRTTRPPGAGSSGSSPPLEGEFDARTLLERWIGCSADEVLSRIANGDPLKLYSRVAHQIRDRHFLLDPDRVFEHALSMVAVGVELEGPACLEADWLTARIDRAIHHVLNRDSEEECAGIPAEAPERHYPVFIEAFFMEPHLARLSGVRFNALPDRARKGFYHLIVEGRPLEEVLAMNLWTPDQLQEDTLRGLQAIGLFDEKGFHQLLGKGRQS